MTLTFWALAGPVWLALIVMVMGGWYLGGYLTRVYYRRRVRRFLRQEVARYAAKQRPA